MREFGRAVREHWVAVLICALVGAALAVGFGLTQPREYSSRAQNFVAVGELAPGSQEGWSGGSAFALGRVKSYVPVIDSPQVLEPVIAELGLDLSVGALADKVSASNPTGTVLLDVRVTGTDRSSLMAITDTVAASYAEQIELLETPPGADTSPVKVTTTAQASSPTASGTGRPGQAAVIGLVLGLLVGLGYVAVRRSLDRSVRTGQALEDATGADVLARIPAASGKVGGRFDLGPDAAEAFRILRTNLQHLVGAEARLVLSVTSGSAAEGRSTVAVRTGIAFAEAGYAVCVVDADLRNRGISSRMDLLGGRGLVDVLVDGVELQTALAEDEGLALLGSGRRIENPAELLASSALRDLIEELRARYQVVVFDTPPLLSYADAAIVAAIADDVLLVAREGRTTVDQAGLAADALDRVAAMLVGAVLNGTHGGAAGRAASGTHDPALSGVQRSGSTVGHPAGAD